jgi:hypothetical protein
LSQSGIPLFKEFRENLGNVPTNRKKGLKFKENITCTRYFQKSFDYSKAFGLQWLRTYKNKIISKGEFKK